MARKPGFPVIFSTLQDEVFWTEVQFLENMPVMICNRGLQLSDAECVIHPLSVASFRLQRDQNTMADVILNFGSIYLSFRNSNVRESLIPCAEKRWQDCEQPLFILALFLHPSYRSLFLLFPETSLTSRIGIAEVSIYY